MDILQELWSRMGGLCMSFANLYTIEKLFARGCVRVHGVENQTWSFVLLNLHMKLSLSCSPSTKLLQFHNGCTNLLHVLHEATIVCQISKMSQEEVAA